MDIWRYVVRMKGGLNFFMIMFECRVLLLLVLIFLVPIPVAVTLPYEIFSAVLQKKICLILR